MIKKILLITHKLVLTNNIIKYSLIYSDKVFLNTYSTEYSIKDLLLINNNLLFYTLTPWSIKNNNYILDIVNDRYYIIDSGYYYYISDTTNFKITINSINDYKINILDLDKYSAKINLL